MIGALNNIIDGVQDKAQTLVLIITDGLDKVSSARARLLFAESTLLTEPACALVYASPIEFHHRLTAGQAVNIFDEYRMLPNPTVQRRPLTGNNWKLGAQLRRKRAEGHEQSYLQTTHSARQDRG